MLDDVWKFACELSPILRHLHSKYLQKEKTYTVRGKKLISILDAHDKHKQVLLISSPLQGISQEQVLLNVLCPLQEARIKYWYCTELQWPFHG